MTIPATHAEIEQLYLQCELNGYRSVCISACQSEDGVTSVAASLAERFILSGQRTLYVDFNLHKPAFEALYKLDDEIGQLIGHTSSHQAFVGVTAPEQATKQLNFRDPKYLSSDIKDWLSRYDKIVFDTSPLLSLNKNNVPAHMVASTCDATILVTCFGQTTTRQLEQAKSLLDSSGAHLIGSVLNMKHSPSLKEEIQRQIEKLRFIPIRWRQNWIESVHKSELLEL